MQRVIEFQHLFHDGHKHIGGHGDPHLALHGVSEVPKKRLMRRCCLIHLKKSSICQLLLLSAQTVWAELMYHFLPLKIL